MQREIVERAKRGDHDAFALIARESTGRLLGAARLILHDTYRAEDVVQDALIRAWRDLPGLRDADRLDGWLHRLLVNACLDEARRGRRWRMNVELRDIDRAGDVDDAAGTADRDELERGFRRIQPDHRAVLVLYYYLGSPVPEIATTLGIPLGTAKSRLSRALDALRRALADEATSKSLTPDVEGRRA